MDGNHYPQEPEEDEEEEKVAGTPSDDLIGDKKDKVHDVADNDVSESNQIVKEKKPGVDTPKNVEVHSTESSAVARLNIGNYKKIQNL